MELKVEDLLADIKRGIEELRGIDRPPPFSHSFVDQAGMIERITEEFADSETLKHINHESVLMNLGHH